MQGRTEQSRSGEKDWMRWRRCVTAGWAPSCGGKSAVQSRLRPPAHGSVHSVSGSLWAQPDSVLVQSESDPDDSELEPLLLLSDLFSLSSTSSSSSISSFWKWIWKHYFSFTYFVINKCICITKGCQVCAKKLDQWSVKSSPMRVSPLSGRILHRICILSLILQYVNIHM